MGPYTYLLWDARGDNVSHVRDETNRVFGGRVSAEVARLQAQGMTKQAIADRIGISRSALDRYEKGTPPREIGRLAQLAEGFRVTMDYLWGRTDDPRGTASGPGHDDAVDRMEAIAADAKRLAESLRPTPRDEPR